MYTEYTKFLVFVRFFDVLNDLMTLIQSQQISQYDFILQDFFEYRKTPRGQTWRGEDLSETVLQVLDQLVFQFYRVWVLFEIL